MQIIAAHPHETKLHTAVHRKQIIIPKHFLKYFLTKWYSSSVSIFTEQMLELHRGQGMEIYWRDNFNCPTEEEYRLMTIRKTGTEMLPISRFVGLFFGHF